MPKVTIEVELEDEVDVADIMYHLWSANGDELANLLVKRPFTVTHVKNNGPRRGRPPRET